MTSCAYLAKCNESGVGLLLSCSELGVFLCKKIVQSRNLLVALYT